MLNQILTGLRAGLRSTSLCLFSLVALAISANAQGSPGFVYTLTNAPANAVAAFSRAAHGNLTPAGMYPTNGAGTGADLGSQGAIALSEEGRYLAAVNAGSNEVTLFSVRGRELHFESKIASGGIQPVSVAIRQGLVYVVNAGATPNVNGYRITSRGGLEPIPGANRPIGGIGPAQIGFSSDGDFLIVTAKATNTLHVFRLQDGVPGPPLTIPSSGQTPFGFGVSKRDHVIVSEAFGGAPGATAVSSYELMENGNLAVITPSLASGQTAACWIVLSRKGRFAYASNTPSANITGYFVGRNGALALLNGQPVAATLPAGSAPTDMAISTNDRFLYTLNSGNGTIGAFQIQNDGTLTSLGMTGRLPVGVVGLVAH
jgi:6-phosphogluconolactonase (cycloisomerase 2 family)